MVRFKKSKSKVLIEKASDFLIDRLKDEGFIIQYYKSYSSNSVYLKLDYGVSNSVRISDHRGMAYLDYRFNLLTNLSEKYQEVSERGHIKRYYPIEDVVCMFNDILEHRNERLRQHGTIRYRMFMEKSIRENEGISGFWDKSVLV